MRSDCHDCTSAAQHLHHGFTMGCKGCCARAEARSPQAHERRKTGHLDAGYRMLLAQFELTDEQVKAAAAADVLGRVSLSTR